MTKIQNEDGPCEQKKIYPRHQEITETIKEYDIPFLEESRELVSLDNNMVSHTETLDQFELRSIKQFQNFRESVNNNLFYSPIKKNNVQNISKLSIKNKNKPQTSRKQDCTLFSNLFILCQTHKLDLDDFFKLENQACPQAVSTDGELYKGTKSDIVSILKDVCKTQTYDIQPKNGLSSDIWCNVCACKSTRNRNIF